MDDLHRFVADAIKGGPPDFMAPNNFHETALQHRYIERARAIDRNSLVVQGNITNHLSMQPDLLLTEGQRHC